MVCGCTGKLQIENNRGWYFTPSSVYLVGTVLLSAYNKKGFGDVFPKSGPEIFGPFRMCVATHAMLATAKQRRNRQFKTVDKHPIKKPHGKQLST